MQFDTYGAFGHGFFQNLSMGGEHFHRMAAGMSCTPSHATTARSVHNSVIGGSSVSWHDAGPKPRGAKKAKLDMHVRPFVEEIALSEQVHSGS